MNCRRARALLALDVGGDLNRKNSQLAAHLGECAACRRAARELDEDRSRLLSLRGHVAPPDVFSRLRPEIVERISGPEGELGWLLGLERVLARGYRPRYAIAGFALLLGAALSLPFLLHGVRGAEEFPIRIAAVPAPPPPESLSPAEPVVVPADTVAVSPVPDREERTAAPRTAEIVAPAEVTVVDAFDLAEPPELEVLDLATLATEKAGPDTLLMKLTTDDPDIVIYWLAAEDEPAANREGGV